MMEQDRLFVENRRRFFQEQYDIVQSDDAWHKYARKNVDSKARDWFYCLGQERGTRVLNAGSGGRNHGISEPMTHLDLFQSKLMTNEPGLVGNIGNIPSDDNSFDVAICVGSVINYADPVHAIMEFSRVLRAGGLFILEYERSASFEHIWSSGKWDSCRRVKTFYGSIPTDLWVYGDGFIDGLLSASGFTLITEFRFHALSSIVLAITNSPRAASLFTLGDSFLAQKWPLRSIASNRILAVEKSTD